MNKENNTLSINDIFQLKEKHDEFINVLIDLLNKEIEHDGMKISLVNIKTQAYKQNEIIDKLIWAFNILNEKEKAGK